MHAQKQNPQFITNQQGRKTGVILPLKEYHALLEDLRDLAMIAERRDEAPLSHKKVVAELKKDLPAD